MYMEYGGMCGTSCAYEPITKEENLALLELAEKRLEAKLTFIRKMKESLREEKSEKTAKVGKQE